MYYSVGASSVPHGRRNAVLYFFNDHTVMDHYTRVLTMQCLDREVQISSKKDCRNQRVFERNLQKIEYRPILFCVFFLCFEICFYLYINLVWITEALEVIGSIVRVNWC